MALTDDDILCYGLTKSAGALRLARTIPGMGRAGQKILPAAGSVFEKAVGAEKAVADGLKLKGAVRPASELTLGQNTFTPPPATVAPVAGAATPAAGAASMLGSTWDKTKSLARAHPKAALGIGGAGLAGGGVGAYAMGNHAGANKVLNAYDNLSGWQQFLVFLRSLFGGKMADMKMASANGAKQYNRILLFGAYLGAGVFHKSASEKSATVPGMHRLPEVGGHLKDLAAEMVDPLHRAPPYVHMFTPTADGLRDRVPFNVASQLHRLQDMRINIHSGRETARYNALMHRVVQPGLIGLMNAAITTADSNNNASQLARKHNSIVDALTRSGVLKPGITMDDDLKKYTEPTAAAGIDNLALITERGTGVMLPRTGAWLPGK